MLSYNRGILYSKAICDFLADMEDLRDYEIWVETFNNCRESGYCLNVNYYGKHEEGKFFSTFYIWIHESRNGEECAVRWGDDKDFLPEELNFTNMYSEKIYAEQSKYFYPFSPYEIADFISEKIKEHFKRLKMKIIRKYQEDDGFGGAEVFYIVYGDCRATLQRELEEELRETGRGSLPSLNLWSGEGYIHAPGEKYAFDAEILPDLDDDGNTVVKRFEGYNI